MSTPYGTPGGTTPAASQPTASSSSQASQAQAQSSQNQGTASDLLKALDNALAFAASKPEAARQIAEALKSHMPGLIALAQEGRLTAHQFQQLEALMKSGSQPQPAPAAQTSTASNGWTNGRPTAQRSQTTASHSTVAQTPAPQTPYYYPPAPAPAPAPAPPPPPQEPDESTYLRHQLQSLAAQLDPDAVLDKDAEELLVDAVYDFVRGTTEFGARLARHRGSEVLGVRDVQLYLERHLGIRVPGFATEETRQPQTDLPIAQPPRSKAATAAAARK